MNKIIHIPLAIILTVLSIAALAQPCGKIPYTFKEERAIDTTEYTKPGNVVANEEADFQTHFGLEKGKLKSDKEVFSVSSMIEHLYIPVLRRIETEADCSRGRCIAAVKIYYGLRGNDIQLIYEPMFLRVRSMVPGGKFDALNLHKPQSLSKFYVDKAGQFEETNPDTAKALMRAYKTTVLRNPKPRPGTPTTSLTDDDTDAAIFSFQEIIKFNHVISDFPVTRRYYCEVMEIHHGCVFLSYGTEEANSKHTLFFTKKDWKNLMTNKKIARKQVQVLSPLGEGDGANLAHLCPPRCSAMWYPAE